MHVILHELLVDFHKVLVDINNSANCFSNSSFRVPFHDLNSFSKDSLTLTVALNPFTIKLQYSMLPGE
jgi:hypothetical protein